MKPLFFIGIILFRGTAWYANAQLSFTDNGQQINNFDGRGVAMGDFNDDGALDAFVANWDAANNLKVYLNNGEGQFTDNGQHLTTPNTWLDTPAVGDINGDDAQEVITGNIVWLNNGNGAFTADTALIDRSDSGDLAVSKLVDLNNDGYLDLFAIGDYAVARVYLNDSTGRLKNTEQNLGDGLIGASQIALIATGDINNDGSIDAVTAGWRSVAGDPCPNRIWLNDSIGNFHDSGQSLDIGTSHVHGLALGDLNNDGWLDLVMGIQDGTRAGRIYLNDKSGGFNSGTNFGTGYGEKVRLADFDGDGDPDIFLARSFASPSQIWLNDGTGSFQNSGLSLNRSWDGAVGNLNADNKPDLFTVGFNWNGSTISPSPAKIWLNSDPSGIKENTSQLLDVFPNPSKDKIFIVQNGMDHFDSMLKVFSLSGETLLSQQLHTKTSEIDIEPLAKGMFIMALFSDDTIYTSKIVKE
jgi:hypothetical protein